MKIVLHDYFESAEGGGRLSLILARALRDSFFVTISESPNIFY
ncbi:hypothetical protein GMMP15_1830008 [Candidatus Magnetomoraceae bacterium gMMP-15]